MPERLRILQVTARFLPQLGGIERHVYEVARRLPQAEIDPTVLATDAVGGLPPEEAIDGIPVRRVAAWPRGRDYHYAPGIRRLISDGGWDVVHVQGVHTLVAPMAMAAARRAGIPYLVTFHSGGHSSRLRSMMRPLQWLALRPWLRAASQLIAVSEFEASEFAQRLRLRRDRFVVIPNGAEPVAEGGDEAEMRDSDLIVSVGRVERYKGHRRLVAALPHVLATRPNAHLRIVGDGPDRARLVELANQLGVGDRVEIGAIAPEERQQLRALLARAGVFALLSDYEAHPVAVMEALAQGCRVVVAAGTGLQELADRGWARAIDRRTAPSGVGTALLAEMGEPPGVPPALPTWEDTVRALTTLYRRMAGEAG